MTPLERMKKQRTKEAQRRAREAYKAAHVRYAIKYQWRRPGGGTHPGMHSRDYRAWRCFGSLPILFHTPEEAQTYIQEFDIFKNMQHLRKVSCSVEKVLI